MEWRIVHISLQVLVALLESGENSTLEFIVGSNSSAPRYVLDGTTTTAQMTAMELLLYILGIASTGSFVLENDGSNDIAGTLTIALRFYMNDTLSCLLQTILPLLSIPCFL